MAEEQGKGASFGVSTDKGPSVEEVSVADLNDSTKV